MNRQAAVSKSLHSLSAGEVEEAVTICSDYFGGAGTLYEKETVAIIEAILDDDYTPDPALKERVLTANTPWGWESFRATPW